jgi:hypothetical protein
VPHCTRENLDKRHDIALIDHHINAFTSHLESLAPSNDPVWEDLKRKLKAIMPKTQDESRIHVIHELHAAVERYLANEHNAYHHYTPYKKALASLAATLAQSVCALEKPKGLKQDYEASLFQAKTASIAAQFNIDANKVRIQKGHDGIQSFIEVQIEGLPLQEHFKGYTPVITTAMENDHVLKKGEFERQKEQLATLERSEDAKYLPEAKKAEYQSLCTLNTYLAKDWSTPMTDQVLNLLPVDIQTQVQSLYAFKAWDVSTATNLDIPQKACGEDSIKEFKALFDAIQKRQKLITRLSNTNNQIDSDITESITKKTTLNTEYQAALKRDQQKSFLASKEAGPINKERTKISEKINTLTQEKMRIKNKISENHVLVANEINTLNSLKESVISHQMEKAKNQLKDHLKTEITTLLNKTEKEWDATMKTIEQFKDDELKKSRFQTQRFFNHTHLLQYEATLMDKNERISNPTESNEEVSDTTEPSFTVSL